MVMQLTASQTKVCPFCAETILAAAVKCRYCGEFLNTNRAMALMRGDNGQDNSAVTRDSGLVPREQKSAQDSSDEPRATSDVLFSGQPTLWVIAGAILKGGALLTTAIVLIFWHIERTLNLTTLNAAVVGKYRVLVGIGIFLIVGAYLAYKIMQVRMTHYEVSTERIEFGTGLFDRKVDNLDMFRVIDIKLRRSFLDCIVGVGTVSLTTTDKSHPEFAFEKVADSRGLYDAIKKASLSADRKTNVIHME